MINYLIRRILYALPILIGINIITFVLFMSGALSHILFPMVRLGIKILAALGLFW